MKDREALSARRADKRQRILRVALALVDEGGLEQLSLRETAGRAGFSPAGVYEFFPIPPGEYTVLFILDQKTVYERPALSIGEGSRRARLLGIDAE